MITIKLFADLAERAGEKKVEVSSENVRGALIELEKMYPALEEKIFKDESGEELKESITVIKDGRNISYLQGLETELEDGDKISLFPPVGGG